MHEILPGKLWLGNARDGRDAVQVMRYDIAAVVNLAAGETTPNLPRSICYCRFPILDGLQERHELLVMAIDTVVGLIKQGLPTLVCCSAGISRSPAVIAGALAIVRGQSPVETLQQITAGHPHDVSPALWDEVVQVCGEKGVRI